MADGKEEAKDDTNALDTVVEIKGEDEGKDLLIVATVRHLMRPFLTIFFSLLYGAILATGAYLATKEGSSVSWKDVLMAVEAVLLPVIGYHFGKSSKIDKE